MIEKEVAVRISGKLTNAADPFRQVATEATKARGAVSGVDTGITKTGVSIDQLMKKGHVFAGMRRDAAQLVGDLGKLKSALDAAGASVERLALGFQHAGQAGRGAGTGGGRGPGGAGAGGAGGGVGFLGNTFFLTQLLHGLTGGIASDIGGFADLALAKMGQGGPSGLRWTERGQAAKEGLITPFLYKLGALGNKAGGMLGLMDINKPFFPLPTPELGKVHQFHDYFPQGPLRDDRMGQLAPLRQAGFAGQLGLSMGTAQTMAGVRAQQAIPSAWRVNPAEVEQERALVQASKEREVIERALAISKRQTADLAKEEAEEGQRVAQTRDALLEANRKVVQAEEQMKAGFGDANELIKQHDFYMARLVSESKSLVDQEARRKAVAEALTAAQQQQLQLGQQQAQATKTQFDAVKAIVQSEQQRRTTMAEQFGALNPLEKAAAASVAQKIGAQGIGSLKGPELEYAKQNPLFQEILKKRFAEEGRQSPVFQQIVKDLGGDRDLERRVAGVAGAGIRLDFNAIVKLDEKALAAQLAEQLLPQIEKLRQQANENVAETVRRGMEALRNARLGALGGL